MTTIYNIFGEKDAVIAHALREFYAGIKLNLPGDCVQIKGYLNAITYMTEIVIENRASARALADLYFSRSLVPANFDVIRSVASGEY